DFRIKDLSVSRAFGDLKAEPFVTCMPDIKRIKLGKKEKFFVLACDGLWDVLDDQTVVNFVLLNCYDLKTLKRINHDINIANKLAEFAISKGSTDNVTVHVVFLD